MKSDMSLATFGVLKCKYLANKAGMPKEKKILTNSSEEEGTLVLLKVIVFIIFRQLMFVKHNDVSDTTVFLLVFLS